MKVYELRDLARLLLQLADEMEAAGVTQHTELLAEPVRRVNGGIAVTIPGPDLFSEMDRIAEAQRIEQEREAEMQRINATTAAFERLTEEPYKRTYNRVGIPMADNMNVTLSGRVRKADGFCQRSNIERTMVRTTGNTRESVRDAINAAAAQLRLTCFRVDGYRYYRIIDRAPLMEMAADILSAKVPAEQKEIEELKKNTLK